MVQTNGTKSNTRTEEEGCYSYAHAREHSSPGYQSKSPWHEPERIDRADSSNSFILCAGASNSGKIIDQLIDKASNQIQLRESEILEMQAYVEELKQIREQLGEIEDT